MHVVGAWLLVALASRPCLPEELGAAPPAPAEAPAPPPAVPLPTPPAPKVTPPRPIPPPVAQRESARYRIEYGPIPVGELQLSIGAAATGASSVRAGGHGAG